MSKKGKTKTIIAIITCTILVTITWTGFIVKGNEVKNTAEHAKEAVTTLKVEGCDPAQEVDRRCLVLETKWEAINTSQQRLEVGQEKILEALEK